MIDWKIEFFRDIEFPDEYHKELTVTLINEPVCHLVIRSNFMPIADKITAEIFFHALRRNQNVLLVGRGSDLVRLVSKIEDKIGVAEYSGIKIPGTLWPMEEDRFLALSVDDMLYNYDFIYVVADDSFKMTSLYGELKLAYTQTRFCTLNWFYFRMIGDK